MLKGVYCFRMTMNGAAKSGATLADRGIYPDRIREELGTHPAWVQDDVIAWAIAHPGSWTGTSAIITNYFRASGR
jgi:hypothetical protein